MNNIYKQKMKMIEFDLTGTCNINCPLCARNYKALNNDKRIFYNERTPEEIISQIDEYPNLEKINLVGATSEPTLYKEIFKLIDLIHDRNLEIEICTNGTARNENFWRLLGHKLNANDSVYFTVCGSTQELHEVYRVNSDLKKLLFHAKVFREAAKDKKIDYIQHILFDYNKDDLESDEMKAIINEFSHVNYTKTYFTRDPSIYVDQKNIDKLKIHNDDLVYYDAAVKRGKYLVEHKTNNYTITCESLENNNIHIDQEGKVYPCYIWLEESGIREWDGDYKKILNFDYDCCRYCEKNLKKMLAAKGCELL